MSKAIDKEQARWQEAIHAKLCKLTPGATIDGGGCDSGDPLDFTLAEIGQGVNYYANILSDAGQHLKNYQAGGEPEDVVDACHEWHDADKFIQETPGLCELCEDLDTLQRVIQVLWNRFQEAEAAKLSPMGQQISAYQKKHNTD